MNAPAKRFSLTRILTAAPPSPAESPAPAGKVSTLAAVADPKSAEAAPAPVPVAPVAEDAAPPVPETPKPRAVREPRPEPEEKHPKKKRSYSVDMAVCDDLEVLAWYAGRSSSSVVEELVRRYLSQNRAALEKARDVRRESRKA